MSLNETQVSKIAHLARIKLDGEELKHFTREMNGILVWIEQLNEVDTSGVEPMTSVEGTTLRTRPDAVTDTCPRDELLQNAPEATDEFFAVPKVIE